jgi:hypothetical protein
MKPKLSPQRHRGSFSEANAPNIVDVQLRSLCELCGSVVKLVIKDPQITQLESPRGKITQISRNQ